MTQQLSRRSFLQWGMATMAGATALAGGPRLSVAAAPTPRAAVQQIKGYCPFCQVRCTYHARLHKSKIVNFVGDVNNRWTGGAMCPKGLSMVELVNSPHRLTEPMLRTTQGWKTISYAEAVDLVVERINKSRMQHGAAIASRLALTAPLWDCRESELAALMTMRTAGGVNIMPAGEVCISTASNVLNMLLGANTSTTTVDEIVNAHTLVLWGANISETYPPYTRWLDKARDAGVHIISIDCRRTPTSAWAALQLMPRPGTDGALALGAIRHIITTNACDARHIERSTTGFELLIKGAEPYTLSRVAAISGVAETQLMLLYDALARSPRTLVWLGGCLSRVTNGVQTVRSIIALQGIRDNLTGSGKGLLTMEGGKPEGEKEFIDQVCGPAKAEGVNFRRLLSSMKKGELDLLFLNSSYRRYPDATGVRSAIKKVDFVVHRGFFATEELDVAHLFVPATFSLESAGSHYGAEKQVVWRDKALKAPGSCVPDWMFYRDIGKKLAPDTYPYFSTPEELHDRFCAMVEGWGGLTTSRLRASGDGCIWPLPTVESTERQGSIFSNGHLHTEDGKLPLALPLLGAYNWSLPKGSPHGPEKNPEYPLILTQGKVVTQWQQTLTNFAASLAQFSNGRYVLVHPGTAEALQISQGEQVLLVTATGQVEARAELTDTIIPGVVFTPSHFTGSSPYAETRSEPINNILPNYWDRISAQFNGVGCALRKKTSA